MAQYSALLGRYVEVRYRAGELLLTAAGTLVADSGKSIFLEERFSQQGKEKTFRWEIPYQSIMKLNESAAPIQVPEAASPDRSAAAASAGSGLSPKNRPREA
jgi:hypothetical protein